MTFKTKRRSFLGFLAALPVLPFLPKAPEGAQLVRNSVAVDSPIFIVRDGPTTVFTIADGGDANLIFVDATNSRIGMGTATPSCKLDVRSM